MQKESSSKDPLVSVIIPCYNQGRFLDAAIESALAQTYPQVEVIVVDDGSTDATAEVAARYPGVRYFRQENRGLGAARNAGLRESCGDYLIFLDADDRLLPEAASLGAGHLALSLQSAFAAGRFRYIKEDGSFLHEYNQEPARQDFYAVFLQGNFIGMHAAVMYRREAVEQAGGFDPSLPACEDYDLYLRIARRYPLVTHDRVVAEYRRHGLNMSSNSALMLKTVLAVLRSNWPYARAKESYRQAYRAGISSWQEHYSTEIAAQLSNQWSRGQIRGAFQIAKTWLTCAPRQFAVFAWRLALKTSAQRAKRLVVQASSAVRANKPGGNLP